MMEKKEYESIDERTNRLIAGKKNPTNEAIKKLSERAGVEPEKKNLNDKEGKIDWMLSMEKRPYKSMAVGEHNGHYYFGTILQYGRKKVPMIILDNGERYWYWSEKEGKETIVDDEIRTKFGLNYRFDLFDDCVDNLWSNKSIREFIKGKVKQQSFKDLFKNIKAKNLKLMYYPDKRVHDYIACDIISNYFFQLFNAKGRTYFQADFGSGKSRQSLIYQKLSFNSLFASNISAAAFERVIESTAGTLIVDNFDNIQDDLKKAILQCIEVYYKKGGKNIKAAGQGFEKNNPIAFNGYSPLVINNIVGLPEVTESRCNKIQMLKTEKKEIVDIRINEQDSFWVDTKDNLHILALQNWKRVKKEYEDLKVPELNARNLEKTEAVLTIAKIIGEETYNNILRYLIEINEQQSIKELDDDWNFMIFEFLNGVIEGKKEITIKVKEITESLKHKIIQSERTQKSDKLKFSHYTGKILKSNPTFTKKVIDGWVNYRICSEDLYKLIKIKGYDKYLTTPHSTTLNNTNTTNTTIENKKEKNIDNSLVKGSMVSEVSEVKHIKKYPEEKIEIVKIGGKNE